MLPKPARLRAPGARRPARPSRWVEPSGTGRPAPPCARGRAGRAWRCLLVETAPAYPSQPLRHPRSTKAANPPKLSEGLPAGLTVSCAPQKPELSSSAVGGRIPPERYVATNAGDPDKLGSDRLSCMYAGSLKSRRHDRPANWPSGSLRKLCRAAGRPPPRRRFSARPRGREGPLSRLRRYGRTRPDRRRRAG